MPRISEDFESYGLGDLAASGADANWANAGIVSVEVSNAQTHSGTQSLLSSDPTSGIVAVPPIGCGSYARASQWFYNTGGKFLLNLGVGLTGYLGNGITLTTIDADPDDQLNLDYWVHGVLHRTTFPGAIPLSTWTKVTLELQMSSVSGSYVASDGSIKVYINDALVGSVSNEFVTFYNDTDFPIAENAWGSYLCLFHGYLDDIEVVDTCPGGGGTPTIPPPDSTPCCGSGPGPGNPDPTSTPNPGNPPIPLQPWTPMCDGGGTVPFAADVTDAESWAL